MVLRSIVKLSLALQVILTSTVSDVVRLLVFSDSQNNGSVPTVAELLELADPISMLTRNFAVVKRFKVLHDTILTLTDGGSNRIVAHRFTTKLNHVVNYLGDTDASTSNGRGSIFYLILGDKASDLSIYDMDWAFSYYDS